MIYLLIFLQLADIATTHYILRRKIGYEANPLLRWMFDRFGHEAVLILVKAAFIVYMWWAHPQFVAAGYEWITAVLVVFYAWIVGGNVKVILKAQ